MEAILWTYLYYFTTVLLEIGLVTFICLITLFLILSHRNILAERLQMSISVEFNLQCFILFYFILF